MQVLGLLNDFKKERNLLLVAVRLGRLQGAEQTLPAVEGRSLSSTR